MTDSDNPGICQTLLQRAGRGDTAAFAEFYDRTAPAVFGLTRSILSDAARAEETTFEVYLQIWQASARYDPSHGDVFTLLLTMTRRRALDRIRATQSTDATPVAPPPAWSAAGVDQLLAAVPIGPREVLILTYFRGHALAQVAGLLGILQATATSRLTEALSSLRHRRPNGAVDDTHHPVEPSRHRQREDAR